MSAAGERLLKAAAEMRAMSEIPADIQEIARGLMEAYASGPEAIIGAAIQAILAAEQRGAEREREACAKLAEEDCRTALAIEHDYKPTWYVRAQKIAAAIRSRGEG